MLEWRSLLRAQEVWQKEICYAQNSIMSNSEKFRQFGLSIWSIGNRKTVFLIMAVILLGGYFAYTSMPKENFPELQIPEIYIGIAKPGSSPQYMADKIIRPIEKELATLKRVDEINSDGIHGYATIRVKFDFSVNVQQALQKVKDAVDKARSKADFPELQVEPNIFELDPSQMPIMNINLRGDNPRQLKETAELLEDLIEDLPEINAVDIRGIQKEEMRIEVDRIKAEASGVSLTDIENAIKSEHQSIPGGEILMDGMRKNIEINGEFKDADELKRVIVKQDDYLPVYLEDVAQVYFGSGEATSYAREFSESVVMLDVKKQGGKNLLEAADKIDSILVYARNEGLIPSSVKLSVTNNQSNQTRDMVSDLENSIIFGVLLVVFVLLFFLGLRNALFVGVAIPLSMLMSFMILDAMGVSLNVMVLFSLVLALGMLVDNGIVVVENIYRYMDEGMESFAAARRGVSEVAWPIIASTATTLAAFIPLMLWPGIMGEFMKYLPITLMIVLGSSLFVALVINPVLTALYMKVEAVNPDKKKAVITALIFAALGALLLFASFTGMGNFMLLIGIMIVLNVFVLLPMTVRFQEGFLPRIERAYERFLKVALKGYRPIGLVVGTFVLLILSFVLIGIFQPKVEFFPVNQPNFVNLFVSHPIGTDIETTNQTAMEVEQELYRVLKPYLDRDANQSDPEKKIIQSIITQVGQGAGGDNEVSLGSSPHKAKVVVNFADFKYRGDVVTGDILKLIQEELPRNFTADIEILAVKNEDGPPQKDPIYIEVTGKLDYQEIIEDAYKIRAFLERRNVEGVEKLKMNVEANRPEIPLVVDREQVRKLSSSTMAVGMAIRTALLGNNVATYSLGEDSYDIVVRFNEENRNDLNALLDQRLNFRNNMGQLLSIPIRSVVLPPVESVSYSAVSRKNQIPMVVISSKNTEGYNANEVVDQMRLVMEDYEREVGLPDGISYRFAGQQDEQEKEMAFLSKALLIAVFLILIIIVTQFNSYSAPVIILLSVVFSLVGVFLGLVLSGMSFVIMMTMIGIISLAGVVVNNAIVLIDYTNLLRKDKREERNLTEFDQLSYEEVLDLTIKGGKTRLRPVLLTAITTILGLIPLAIGFNIDFSGLLLRYEPNIYFGGDNNIFFAPMSWTIIFGLTFATFLTLVVVPALYLNFFNLKNWIYRKAGWKMRSDI
jgi:multidrug efflux pump